VLNIVEVWAQRGMVECLLFECVLRGIDNVYVGEKRISFRVLVRICDGKWLLARPMHGWEDNVE